MSGRAVEHRWRWAFALFLVFIPMPALGTLWHEAGHVGMAEFLGYPSTLHFDSTTYAWPDPGPQPAQEKREELLILLAGPACNIGLGCLGWLGLAWVTRRRRAATRLQRGQLALSLLALFWSRQIFNLAWGLWVRVQSGEWPGQDEVRIAELLGWPQPVGLWVTGAVAGVVIFVVIRQLPAPLRVPFVFAGLLGCAIGYPLWYAWLGPLWLP